MDDLTVQKEIRIQGHDERDLDLRIEFFMDAVHRRSGTVLDIEWLGEADEEPCAATVRFELPLFRARFQKLAGD